MLGKTFQRRINLRSAITASSIFQNKFPSHFISHISVLSPPTSSLSTSSSASHSSPPPFLSFLYERESTAPPCCKHWPESIRFASGFRHLCGTSSTAWFLVCFPLWVYTFVRQLFSMRPAGITKLFFCWIYGLFSKRSN